MNTDQMQKDPPKTCTDWIPWDSMETHLRAPSGDARRTTGIWIECGRHYSYRGTSPRHTVPTKTMNLTRTRTRSLPPAWGRDPWHLHGPKDHRKRGGSAVAPTRGRGKLEIFSCGRGKRRQSLFLVITGSSTDHNHNNLNLLNLQCKLIEKSNLTMYT